MHGTFPLMNHTDALIAHLGVPDFQNHAGINSIFKMPHRHSATGRSLYFVQLGCSFRDFGCMNNTLFTEEVRRVLDRMHEMRLRRIVKLR